MQLRLQLMMLVQKTFEQGLRTLTVQVKGPGSEEKLLYDLYSQEVLKFYQLRIPLQCHIMEQGHQKEGEYNADYI